MAVATALYTHSLSFDHHGCGAPGRKAGGDTAPACQVW